MPATRTTTVTALPVHATRLLLSSRVPSCSLPAFSAPLPCLDPLPVLSCCYTHLPLSLSPPLSLPTIPPSLLFTYVAQLKIVLTHTQRRHVNQQFHTHLTCEQCLEAFLQNMAPRKGLSSYQEGSTKTWWALCEFCRRSIGFCHGSQCFDCDSFASDF